MKREVLTSQLTKRDTQILKGIAVLMLLFHHCLYTGEGYDDFIINGVPFFKNVGIFCKICVAIFVFLSGYGLTKQTRINDAAIKPMRFYGKRYVKLMMNYWLIWLLFVPMGVLFYGRTFPSVYGNHYLIKGIIDFLGIYMAVFSSPNGYNATWWFYSCIIVLYLLYPFIWNYRKYWFVIIPISISLSPSWGIPFFGSSGALAYLFTFICGMAYSYVGISGGGRNVSVTMVLVFISVCIFRFLVPSTKWDSVIVILGVYVYKLFPSIKIISSFFHIMGKHSFNIFLFHTFIYAYYFHDYIFWSANPIIIISTLLFVCLLVSMGIERIKILLNIDKIQNQLIQRT